MEDEAEKGGRRTLLLLNWRDPRNPLAGGAEEHVWQVFGRFRHYGWRVHALTAAFPGCARSEQCGPIRVFRTGGDKTYWAAAPCAYRRLAKRLEPDLVVDFMNKLPLCSPLYVNAPLAVFVHHLFGSAAAAQLPPPASTLFRTVERLMLRCYRDAPFLTGSESSREELVRAGIPSRRTAVVPYGTDAARLKPGPKAAEPTLIYLGRLKKYKGVDHILRALPAAAAQIPRVRFDVVGEGDDRPRLERMAAAMGLEDRVRFHGYLDEAVKIRLLQGAWLAVFPSAKEGFGLTIPEAALCGTPTVAYDAPGLRDAIQHGETGVLVPPEDTGALAEALMRLLRDDVERARLAENARRAYGDFTWESAAEKTLAALHDFGLA